MIVMKGSVKSVNFAAHGAIGEVLTDKQIDEYTLHGRYGRDRQLKMLDDVRHRRCTRFDARIRKGEFGQEAMRAMKERRRRRSDGSLGATIKYKQSAEGLSELQIKILCELGLEM